MKILLYTDWFLADCSCWGLIHALQGVIAPASNTAREKNHRGPGCLWEFIVLLGTSPFKNWGITEFIFEQKLVFPSILYRYYLCSLNVSYLALFWQKQASNHEVYAPISLVSKDGDHFCEPVRVPGVPDVFERAYVLQKIKGTNSTERV